MTLAVTFAPLARGADTPAPVDPNLWLEGVTDEKALAWVRERNAASVKELAETPAFKKLEAEILAILDSDQKIPFVKKIGDHYYNFWRDKDHVRGLWRRTTLAEYRKAAPNWETVIDLDALGKAEGENWVWSGADCLRPAYQRCLISLSRGGADATVVREFDLPSKAFVKDGFFVPEAKNSVSWIDADTQSERLMLPRRPVCLDCASSPDSAMKRNGLPSFRPSAPCFTEGALQKDFSATRASRPSLNCS